MEFLQQNFRVRTIDGIFFSENRQNRNFDEKIYQKNHETNFYGLVQREKFAEFLELKGDLANLLEHYLDMVTFLLTFGIKMFQHPKRQIVLIPLD